MNVQLQSLPSVLGYQSGQDGTPLTPHLPNGRVLLSQSNDDDAVGLTDAPLCPWRQRVVRLVKNYAVDVFLLAQPAGQPVLMDTEEDRSSLLTDRITSLPEQDTEEIKRTNQQPDSGRRHTPVQRRRSKPLFDAVTGQQECGT